MPGLVRMLHAYVYGRWTRQYKTVLIEQVIPRLGERGRRWWADRFHCKVLTTEHARAIVTLDRDIRLRDLEQIVPYPMARDLVVKGPPDIAVYDCACRRRSPENPCLPLQVCMIVGKPYVEFILKHHPGSSRRIGREEALSLLDAEHARGHLHSAWFKDAMGGRFYAICNCFKCCCLGITAMVKYGTPMVAPSGYVARVDEARCTGCAACAAACPFGAIRADGTAAVDWHACMGCGVCAGQCPAGAVALVRDAAKGVPLDVRALAGN